MDSQIIRVVKAVQGLGTEELAGRAGVSRFTVHNWESGRRPVSAESARRIEDALLGRTNGTGDVHPDNVA